MEMTGEQRIDAPRARVWAALNDPEVLKACIPGCQSLVKTDDTHMKALAGVKVGPISARFSGEVTLSDIDPPNGYRITGEGQGGAAGFAKGGALVRLAEDGGATLLTYEVTAQVGGKLAQLGGPLIDATAKQMAGAFFKKLAEAVVVDEPAPAPATGTGASAGEDAPIPMAAEVIVAAAGVAAPLPSAPPTRTLPATWLAAAAACAVLAGFFLGRAVGGWGGGTAIMIAIASALLVLLTALVAYSYGRAAGQAARPDPRHLAQLIAAHLKKETAA